MFFEFNNKQFSIHVTSTIHVIDCVFPFGNGTLFDYPVSTGNVLTSPYVAMCVQKILRCALTTHEIVNDRVDGTVEVAQPMREEKDAGEKIRVFLGFPKQSSKSERDGLN